MALFARDGAGLAVPPLLDGLAAALPEQAILGGWDAGFAGGFDHVWWAESGGWTCVDGRGAPRLWTRGRALHSRAGHLPEVSLIQLLVAPGWVRRSLRARGPAGELPMVDVEDPAPVVDPTYDVDMLGADLAWLEELAASLGAALGAPVEAEIAGR